jgi:uncharacterized protein
MRIGHMIVFLGLFAAVLGLSHAYLFARIGYLFQLTAGQRHFTAFFFGIFAVLTLVSLPLSLKLPREAAAILAWAVFPWMGFVLLMFAFMVTADAVWFALKLFLAEPLHDPGRRFFIQRGLCFAVLGSTALLGCAALWNGLRPVKVKPLTIALKKLPKSLDGLRIAQITDLHIGAMIDGTWLRRVVDQVNALKPDIIAITGDLVDGSVEDLGHHIAPMANLKAPLGVYFITGNHEYYSGVEAWCAYIAGLGVRVLRNERVSIAAGGESFDLAGVDDWRSRSFPGQGPDLRKALAGRDKNKALVLLAHQPVAVHEAAALGVDLQLSGHTHGGQLWPFTYLVYLQQPYVDGLHRHRDTNTQIYVSPGTGFWGPPMRLGTAAEITHITLISKDT